MPKPTKEKNAAVRVERRVIRNIFRKLEKRGLISLEASAEFFEALNKHIATVQKRAGGSGRK